MRHFLFLLCFCVACAPDLRPGELELEDDDSAVGARASAAARSFAHPGIMVNASMLAHVRQHQGEEPWKSALGKAKSSWLGSLSYTPHPRRTVECGSYSNPDYGCSDEKSDAAAAYTHALLWYHTGREDHARKAIQIMNAWSSTIQNHTNSNAPLQAAWVAEVFPRAAEIIRYTYTGWPEGEVARFERMLRNAYLPLVRNGSSSNGNWELSMIEATINIGVFTNDADAFDKGVKMWRERVPAYIYLESDGARPVPPPRGYRTGEALIGFWYDQRTFVNGLAQETCRDIGHTQYGLAAIINAAETAYLQGVDLYGEQKDRIRHALGFHAKYLNGESVPSWLCGGTLKDKSPDPMWEVGFNHYGVRLGIGMSNTSALAHRIRASGADHHMVWETLTHGDLGRVGVP
jgi:hypothetical protein